MILPSIPRPGDTIVDLRVTAATLLAAVTNFAVVRGRGRREAGVGRRAPEAVIEEVADGDPAG